MDKLKDDAGMLSAAGFYYGIKRNTINSINQVHRKKQPSIQQGNDARLAKFKIIGQSVERWAGKLLSEENGHKTGWVPISCNKALKRKYNENGSVKQYIKWMPDSREQFADTGDKKYHPCMKLYATIDAPLHIVCKYLSQEHRYREYNSLLIDQRDIEEIAPDAKICWSQTKKLLFIQPRDFITFCRHRWKQDGSQVVVNQAWDYPEIRRGKSFRAYALRGATYISKDPICPAEKTRIILLAHCNCGEDIPEWAVRTAVGILAPIKPFEIIYRISLGVKRAQQDWAKDLKAPKAKVHSLKRGRSSCPAGIAQMGFACFWPKGGGLIEK